MICKICQLPLKPISNNPVVYCPKDPKHYYAIINENNLIAECWLASSTRTELLRQVYMIVNPLSLGIGTFISFKGLRIKTQNILFDFNHFNEQEWRQRIELLKFYQ